MTIFYFTGTGNSLAIAKSIGGKLISIPQVIDGNNLHFKDEAIGIVFPVYALIAPKMVRAFLDKAKFETDYLYAIGTYGNSGGSSLFSLQKQAQKNGYSFDYLDEILMVDNCLPIFEIGAEIAKIPQKKTDENTTRVVANIQSRKKNQATSSIANRAVSAVVGGLLKYEKSAQKYIINDNCNKCGICAQVCPAKNIEVASNIQFDNHCAGCQACLHLCPKNAIHLKNEKSNKRWCNPEVSLDEIIEANNRTK